MAPPPNDALLAYLEGKFAALDTRMYSIDSSIASLRTSFDTRFTSLESRIGGIETSIAGFMSGGLSHMVTMMIIMTMMIWGHCLVFFMHFISF
ncbi:hypothetical protein V6N11_049829 [Hibiscus sabdariffa]|uniref:Uncharacterized protein n=1 Tax=Hibiscus sabdariffa TaxID=183260 RepID=A0ABR2T816_9ROSI